LELSLGLFSIKIHLGKMHVMNPTTFFYFAESKQTTSTSQLACLQIAVQRNIWICFSLWGR